MQGKVPTDPEAVASGLKSQKSIGQIGFRLIVPIREGSVLERSGIEWPHCTGKVVLVFPQRLKEKVAF